MKFLDEVTAHTPSPLRLWLGPQLYVVIHDAVNAEIVTKSRYCLDKPGVYDIVKDALGGDGLFSMQSGYLYTSVFFEGRMMTYASLLHRVPMTNFHSFRSALTVIMLRCFHS